jgi:hypothetical protein
LVQKWRVFLRAFELDVDTVVDIVKAACCLHNYLKVKGELDINEEEHISSHNAQALTSFQPTNSRSNFSAYAVREEFISYFNQ